MAKNIVAAQVNFSVMAGSEAVYGIDVLDYLGAEVSEAGAGMVCSVRLEDGEVLSINGSWDELNDRHVLTFPAMEEGRHAYEIALAFDDGSSAVLAQGWIACFNRLEWREPVHSNSPNRTLRIMAPDGKGCLEAQWMATGAAEGFADIAAQGAAKVEGIMNDMSAKLVQIQKFLDSFDAALRECVQVVDNYLWIGGVNTGHYLKGADGVTPEYGADGYWYVNGERVGKARGDDGITPHITPDGYWAIGSIKTDVYAAGRDGLDGSAIRRVLIDSLAELPEEEQRGVFYYLRLLEWLELGSAAGDRADEWEAIEVPAGVLPAELRAFRVVAGNANDTPVWMMVRTAAGVALGMSDGSCVWGEGDVVEWRFSEPVQVPDGAAVRFFLMTVPDAVPDAVPDYDVRMKSAAADGVMQVRYHNVWYGGRSVRFEVRAAGPRFDVYAWLEPDGWVNIGEASDIASAEVYGLVKLGTDMRIVGGAPVGRNAEGQMCVPLADVASPGAGRISTDVRIEFGADVGFDADNAFRVPVATMSDYGVGRLGTSVTVDGAPVGFDSQGRWCVPWASLDAPGVIKLGSRFGQSNPEPYIVGIGMTQNHEIANNYAFGGALQHRRPDGWRGTMAWLDDSMEASSEYFGDMFYSGLLTSAQFSQSQNGGLALLEATGSRLAGVYLAFDMDDVRAAAVPTAEQVKGWVQDYAFSRSDTYSREQLSARFLSQDDARSQYVRQDNIGRFAVKNGSGSEVSFYEMTMKEFDALTKRDLHGIYFITRS